MRAPVTQTARRRGWPWNRRTEYQYRCGSCGRKSFWGRPLELIDWLFEHNPRCVVEIPEKRGRR